MNFIMCNGDLISRSAGGKVGLEACTTWALLFYSAKRNGNNKPEIHLAEGTGGEIHIVFHGESESDLQNEQILDTGSKKTKFGNKN